MQTATQPTRSAYQNITAENRLVELRLLNDTLVATYAVDGNSLRVSKVWNGSRTWYLYAGTQLISEYEDAASATYNPGTNAGGAGSDAYATILYQHGDHLTTRLTTDNNGDYSNEQRHYPYGEKLQGDGTADASVLRKFTTYLKEEETDSTGGKLNYAVFRSHSARTGRFLMADPVRGNIKNPQRLNRYSYVGGDPTNRIDPSGRDWEDGSQTLGSNCGLNPWDPKCDKPLMEGGGDYPVLVGRTPLGSWITYGTFGIIPGWALPGFGSGSGGMGIGGALGYFPFGDTPDWVRRCARTNPNRVHCENCCETEYGVEEANCRYNCPWWSPLRLECVLACVYRADVNRRDCRFCCRNTHDYSRWCEGRSANSIRNISQRR
jgi:RHS repeat-associated protein